MSPKPSAFSSFFIAMVSVCRAFSCASTGAIADATAHVMSSTRLAFALGAAGVTSAGACGLPTKTFSRAPSPRSIALDNAFKLAALLDWDVPCSSAVIFWPLAAVSTFCGVGAAATAAQVCGTIASLPVFLCSAAASAVVFWLHELYDILEVCFPCVL